MFEVSVTEERDLLVFVRGRTIGVVFNGPTGSPDERHEADLTDLQRLELLNELREVRGRPAPIVTHYPSPSYEDLVPPPRSTVVRDDDCCGGGCCG